MKSKAIARAEMFERMNRHEMFGGKDCSEIVINYYKEMNEDDRTYFKHNLTACRKSAREPVDKNRFLTNFGELSEKHQLYILALGVVFLDPTTNKFVKEELEKIDCGWALTA